MPRFRGGDLDGGMRKFDLLQPGDVDMDSLRLQSLLFAVALAIFFYLNMYVLVPRILSKKSWKIYLLTVLLGFGFVAGTSELINHFTFTDHFRPGRPFYFTVINFLLVFGLSTALRLSSDRIKFERERKERENENLKSELSLLRSQVSPHFMFNVLNNLASLARKKSDQLESVIIQLSQLMRYMLYDSGEKRVTVDEEIQYLESYIDLQKLRFGQEITIRFNAEVSNGNLPIEPMLLIPFVENAFKHGAGIIKDPHIFVDIVVNDHILNFMVRNGLSNDPLDAKDPGSGIGIQNARRRLELLYKDLHQLSITADETQFVVELMLILQ